MAGLLRGVVVGWRRGKARARRVGVVVGLARRGGARVRRVGAVARFSRGGLAPKSGMHAVLGRRRSSVAASLARSDGVEVAADLHVAKIEAATGLRAVKQRRRRGLARLEGRGTGVGIMWWRDKGLRTRHVGERGSLEHWSEK